MLGPAETREPYLIYGYTGHVPGYKYRVGVSYGKATHKLFLDPCARVMPSQRTVVFEGGQLCKDASQPTADKLRLLDERLKVNESVYAYPMPAGYGGHIPRIQSACGDRVAVTAVNGITEFERLMQVKRCEKENTEHRDILASGRGVFHSTVNERLEPKTTYRAPLRNIRKRARVDEMQREVPCTYKEEEEPYTKATVPLFMECTDKNKYITANYAGHIPLKYRHFGMSNKRVTHNALCEYSSNRKRQDVLKWCPGKGLKKYPLPLAAPCYCPDPDYPIYRKDSNMTISYAGHVPGQRFVVGKTFGSTTYNAKQWLKDAPMLDTFEDLVFR